MTTGPRLEVQLKGIPLEVRQVWTPLVIKEWEKSLRRHPDKEFCAYLLQSMAESFREGFQYTRSSTPVRSNMKSAFEHPGVIDGYLGEKGKLDV